MFKRLIGIDYGKSRIGIASGQMVTKTATPITTIAAKNGVLDWQQLISLLRGGVPMKL